MTVDNVADAGRRSADAASELSRRARKGVLATLEAPGGHPYASLVTVATEPGGAPVLLLSGLARHTRNLLADPRASLLIDGTDAAGDPLAGGRVTLVGVASPTADRIVRRRFLARHPEAADYADFADFGFWRIAVERAHWIGGFGRIVEVAGADICHAWSGDDALVAAEPELLAKLNDEPTPVLALLAGAPDLAVESGWRASGIDRRGIDLTCGARTSRATFPQPVEQADAAFVQIQAMLAARTERR